MLRQSMHFDEAERVFNLLFSRDDLNITEPLNVEARLEFAALLIEQGKYESSIQVLIPFQDSNISQISPVQSAKAMCTKAEALIRFGNYENAEIAINECKSLEFHLSQRNMAIEAYGEHLQGFLYHEEGYFLQALDHYQSALLIKSKLDGIESLDYSNTLNNIANVYFRLGDYPTSIDLHSQTLKIRQVILSENHPKIGGSLGNLGNLYLALGNARKALDYQEQASIIWKTTFGETHPDLSFTFDNMGVANAELKRFEESNRNFQDALKVKELVLGSKHPSTANSLYGAGKALIGMKKPLQAIVQIKNALSIYRQNTLTHHPKYVEALGLMAQANYMAGKKSFAEELFRSAIDTSNSHNHNQTVSLLNDYASMKLLEQQYSASIDLSQRAMTLNFGQKLIGQVRFNPPIGSSYDIVEAIGSLLIKAKSLHLLGVHKNENSLLKEALDTYERALAVAIYSWRLDVAPDAKDGLNADLEEIVQGAISVAHSLYSKTNEKWLLDKIFQFVEFKKSGHFFDELTDAEAKIIAHVPDSLKFRELELKNKIASFDRQLIQLSETTLNPGFSASVTHERFITRKLLDELVSNTERLFPRYYALKHGGIYANINDVFSSLIKSTKTLIQYYEVEDTTYALVMGQDNQQLIKIGSSTRINNIIDKFVSISGVEFTQIYFDHLHLLYQILLEPILQLTQHRQLIIIPDGKLHRVPFDALLVSPINVDAAPQEYAHSFPFLIKEYSISIGYSATLMIQQSKVILPKFDKQLLAFGPVFDDDEELSPVVSSFLSSMAAPEESFTPFIEPLYGSLDELNEIESIIDSRYSTFTNTFNNQSIILRRHEATESYLKQADLSRYRFLHFATHSFADQNNPVNSGVLLEKNGLDGEDGILHASEIFSLNVPAELVVLSSCDTALEFNSVSGGLSGFARGFIYAGAKNLIASLWPSDDLATRMLMRHLYAYLASDYSIESALRTAKMDIIATDGPISHPYYWSGFIHIGSSVGSVSGVDSPSLGG